MRAAAISSPFPRRLLVLALLTAVGTGCAAAQKSAYDPPSIEMVMGDAEGGEEGGEYESDDGDGRGWAERENVATESAPGFFDFADDEVAGGLIAPDSSSLKSDRRPSPKPAPVPSETPPRNGIEDPAGPDGGDGTDGEKTEEAAKRLVIYTGSMSLLVPQLDKASADFLAHVDGLGGYLQSRQGAQVTVRIPAAQFFPTLEWLRKHGEVQDEAVNAADVTKKVFDLELRLQTATEARKRLLKILESATLMNDILAIEAQLRRLTDEIEGMKGELRNLGDQIAFSTLTVQFYANAPAPTPYPRRTRSRFPWINQVGIERVLNQF